MSDWHQLASQKSAYACIVDASVDRLQSFSSVIREASPESKNAERVLYYDDPSHTEFRTRILSPEPLFCDGFCRTQNNYYFGKQSEPTAEVVSTRIDFDEFYVDLWIFIPQICLSSSKDAQKTWEDAEGNSMTQVRRQFSGILLFTEFFAPVSHRNAQYV